MKEIMLSIENAIRESEEVISSSIQAVYRVSVLTLGRIIGRYTVSRLNYSKNIPKSGFKFGEL